MQGPQTTASSKARTERPQKALISDAMRSSYDHAYRALLLVLCFYIPVQVLLPVSTHRMVEALIFLIGGATFVRHGGLKLLMLVRWSFWLGAAGWLMSTTVSTNVLHSTDAGMLEFLAFYIVLYITIVHLHGTRDFALGGILFALGAGLVAATQTASIVISVREHAAVLGIHLPFPLYPASFVQYKDAVPQFLPAGVPRSYGNIDNYASLFVLLMPWLVGLSFVSPWRWLAGGLFLLHAYAGLVVYSRGALCAVFTAILILWLFQFRVYRRLRPAMLVALFGLVVALLVPQFGARVGDGVITFADTLSERELGRDAVQSPERLRDRTSSTEQNIAGQEQVENREAKIGDGQDQRALDRSASDRARAWVKGLSIGIHSRFLGVGYGMYPTLDPELTAPHSLFILRFAEGGLLSLMSFVALVLYVSAELLRIFGARERDMLRAACLCAAFGFLIKSALFGANFSVSSNLVWAFGLALCLATYRSPEDCSEADGEVISPPV
jgi:hypothetical protein